MKKIIHLSDIHIGSTKKNGRRHNGDTSERFENLIRWLNTTDKLEDRKNYVIVITGDISHDGKTEYFSKAKELINTIHDDFDIFVVPGNHDYRTNEDGGISSPDDAANEFLNQFYKGNNTLPRRAAEITTDRDFPRIHIVDSGDTANSIAFIGVDSGEERKGKFSGMIGRKQLDILGQVLKEQPEVSSCKYKVVYLHHDPFKGVKWWKKLAAFIPGVDSKGNLRDRSEFLDILENNVTLLLYGHTHAERSNDIDADKFNQYGIDGIYNGGTSTGRHKHSTCIRIIDLKDPENPDEDTIPLFWEL